MDNKTTVSRGDLLSTGSTLLNMACSGYPDGGYAKGMYFYLVGDTSSGKTFFSRTCLAEATRNENFKEYRLIYDDVEYGALMDTRTYFGPLADRIESPCVDDDGAPLSSSTLEEFYYNITDILAKKKPCIYILDSMDALGTEYAKKKFNERKTASRKGTKAKGDYGDGKAKMNSENMRVVLAKLKETGSILIVISQTRDNIANAMMFGPKKTRAGGHSLSFYATTEIWTSVCGKVMSDEESKTPVGIMTKLSVKKNRLTGMNRTVKVPILYNYGIDNISSCVDYLVESGRWSVSRGGIINAHDLSLAGLRSGIISEIENDGLESSLSMVVADEWREQESRIAKDRKPRY